MIVFFFKFIQVVVLLIVAVMTVHSAPQGSPNEITIIKQEENNSIGVGGYHFSYEQSDGQKREETAELKNEGTENESISVVGSFSYLGPDGKTYRVNIYLSIILLSIKINSYSDHLYLYFLYFQVDYTADENVC